MIDSLKKKLKTLPETHREQNEMHSRGCKKAGCRKGIQCRTHTSSFKAVCHSLTTRGLQRAVKSLHFYT